MADALPYLNAPPLQAANLPTFQKPGGMFGGGGKFGLKEALAFGLAGLVSRHNPMLLQGLMGAVMQRQKQQQDDQDYQRHRTDALTDYEAQQKIDQQYPTTPAPTEYERALQASGIKPGTPEWAQHMGSFVNMRENPPFTYVDPSTGAVMMGARSQPQILDALPPGARPIGGPTPSASGSFPGY
jgi:hypothetical protein